jgi:hypothetical protein
MCQGSGQTRNHSLRLIEEQSLLVWRYTPKSSLIAIRRIVSVITITNFGPDVERLLPEVCALLRRSNLVIHDGVAQLFILGSRGLAGGFHAESDVDLSLMVDMQQLPQREPDREHYLRQVLDTTLTHWQGSVETDLAAVFDTFTCCGLRCFQTRNYDPDIIRDRGIDCFGIYKIQRGFNGYVTQGVQLAPMYPLLRIWHR